MLRSLGNEAPARTRASDVRIRYIYWHYWACAARLRAKRNESQQITRKICERKQQKITARLGWLARVRAVIYPAVRATHAYERIINCEIATRIASHAYERPGYMPHRRSHAYERYNLP